MNISKQMTLSLVLACVSYSTYALENVKSPGPLSDAQITSVLEVANDGEADLGRLAQIKTQNPDVKAFADDMVAEHSEAKALATQAANDMKMKPAPYVKTNELKAAATKSRIKLQKLNGRDFDKAYMDSQIAMHKEVLRTIDDQLLPNVKSAQMKTMIQDQRPKIEAHLRRAEELRKKL
jgi:putative membrane protein